MFRMNLSRKVGILTFTILSLSSGMNARDFNALCFHECERFFGLFWVPMFLFVCFQNKSPASSNRFPPAGSQRIFLFALVHSRTRGVTTRNRVGGKETWGAHEGAPSDNGTVENCSSCNPRRRYDQIHIHTYTFTRT
ncbi:unnamed protein product [Musa acuminata var. zebrina]